MLERIKSERAPKAIGSYSQATKVGNLIFTSGQLPINPETGQIDEKDSIKWQVKQSLNNVKAILEDNDSSMDSIVKATVYLDNIKDFSDFNEVYQEFFEKSYPARSAFEVAKLPMDALVEIEVIAEVENEG
ncbi:Rid family detoxifying hydrolase [uncultured Helcococcus sp.]|uniref:Rid family detoxifying hydrolase n=1 Tax=uncultured Helcococcus sp. TaxID=1072508 RepID=UPI00260C99A2|nr:Rid family detoxifying hydrolase [uncultured Helcococcus sp.]